jgi:hypothetical protein
MNLKIEILWDKNFIFIKSKFINKIKKNVNKIIEIKYLFC